MRKRGYGLGSGVGEVKSKMNNSWPKNRATSRRSGQRHDVTERGNKRNSDVRGNVATL